MDINEQVQKLYDALNAEEIHPMFLSQGFPEYSPEIKNALVAQLASTFSPSPSGRVLARLSSIMNDENKDDILMAYLANYHSPDPEARRASLYGLAALGYPSVADLALLSLRDPSDLLVAAACDILIPRAQSDARILHLLQGVYATHKGDPSFHMSIGILDAHHIA